MDSLLQDLRFALRTLTKSPGFALVAIATLALGIGANSAIFSALNSTLLRPLPGRGTERLVAIYSQDEHAEFPHELTYPDLVALRRGTSAFDGLAGRRFILAGVSNGDQAVQVAGELVTADFFDVLGIEPALGRGFRPEEESQGGEPVAVISHGLFERQFGGDETVVDSTMVLNGRNVRVVGVMPPKFTGSRFPVRFDVWMPMAFFDIARPGLAGFDWRNARLGHWLEVIGRLREGVSLEEARAQVDLVMQRLETEFPDSNRGVSALTVYERDARIASGSHQGATSLGALLVMGLVGLVLLVACANVANLVLARTAGRRRELGMRLALGSGRLRLLRQLLTESLLLALAGGALGWLLALWTSRLLLRLMPSQAVPLALDFSPDLKVLAFTALVTVASVLVFGLTPALGACRGDLVPLLKGEARGVPRRLRPTLRSALTVVQVSLSLVLLVAAGLFVRSLIHAQKIDPGFRSPGLVLFDFNVGLLNYTEAQGRNFFAALEERVSAIPGVEAVATSYLVPLSGSNRSRNIEIDERPLNPEGGGVGVACNMVGPGFFKTLGIDLLRGRELTSQDRRDAPGVVVVNTTLAEWLWPGEDPLGRRIRLQGGEASFEVVGVVPTGKYRTLGEDSLPFLYFARQQFYDPSLTLNVRYAGDPDPLVARVREEVRSLDPNLPINAVRTMDEHRRFSLALAQMSATLASSFGGVALLLAAVGLYGVLAGTVARRRREIGVRMALGARRQAVLGLILAQGLRVTVLGLAIGLVSALGISRLFTGFLYGVAAVDPWTFLVVPLGLLLVATLACLVPARRAARVDPLEVLRYE